MGRDYCDQVLKSTVRQIQGRLRKNELVGRVGADRFLLYLQQDKESLTRLEKLQTEIRQEGTRYPVEISCGVHLLAGAAKPMQRQVKIKICYRKANGDDVNRKVLPISIVSSEYYLYLVGFFEEKAYDYPAFFRLDRILSVEVTQEHYDSSLFEGYNMGKMKQCIQFMEELGQRLGALTVPGMEPVVRESLGQDTVQLLIQRLARQVGLNLTKRKLMEAIPGLGALVGAAMNANYLQDVGWTARRKFQSRWLRDKYPQLRDEQA